jgi:D-3-phosphoglycerate dehydrogenase / 2-oxoglutarate reductase
VANADFLTVHLPKSPETSGLIDAALMARAKPGLRIVNTARGGIVDESALAEAVRAGRVAGAALDVFVDEPLTESPLFGLDSVVVTPHLGASTREAQDKAGWTIAEQVSLALAGEFVPFAVNVGAAEIDDTVQPFLPLAERLGRVYAGLAGELPAVLDVVVQGALADHDTRIVSLAVLRGLLTGTSDVPVTYVNAPQLAEERGVEVRSVSAPTTRDYVNLVTIRGNGHSVGGTIFAGGEPRIVEVDEHKIELPIARWMLVVHNDDRVGMVATVAGALARAGANIVDLKLGRSEDRRTAVMAFSFEAPVPAAATEELDGVPGIHELVVLSDV